MQNNFNFYGIEMDHLSKLNTLSKQQRIVAYYMCKGAKTSEIAKLLNLKANTISTVKIYIFSKLKVSNQIDLYAQYHNFL
jgi:DNA-binding NarL/FixJ family response regulator